jgi:hypothetical protein
MCFKEGREMEPIKKNLVTETTVKGASNDPFYSKRNLDHLHKAVDRLNNGKGKEHNLLEAKND